MTEPTFVLHAAFKLNGSWTFKKVSGQLLAGHSRFGAYYAFSTDTDLFGQPGGSIVPFMKLNAVWGQYDVHDQSVCWFIIADDTEAGTDKAYSDLFDATLHGVNGCGGKGGWFRPVHWFGCTPWCNRHDVAYFNGGTETDRHIADWRLRSDLMHLADQLGTSRLKRIYYRTQAIIYYVAVRLAGWEFFSYDTPMPTNPFARLWRILRGA